VLSSKKKQSLLSIVGTIPTLNGRTEANYEEKVSRLPIFRLIFAAGTSKM
jgi:hypothetical protein